MASGQERPLTQSDLDRAVRAVAGLLQTDEVVVVGSQALIVGRDDIDRSLRSSVEFDMYSANAARWQADNPGLEASEQIAGTLGEGSDFHLRHGYFVDGVDERTATLAADWRSRAVTRQVEGIVGSTILAVAPCATDIVAAKLHRGDPKDQEFASRCMRLGLTHYAEVLQTIRRIAVPDGHRERAEQALRMASINKNNYVASKGPKRDDPVEVMFRRMRDRSNAKDPG